MRELRRRHCRASILLLAYNQRIYTEICLRSLGPTIPDDVEILALDNGSTDDTQKLLKSWPDPRLRVVTVKKNIGVARGYNRLRRHMSPSSGLMVFLNNDIILQPGWFESMEREMRHRDVGVVGARLLYPQTGAIQHAGMFFRSVVPGRMFDMFHDNMNCPADEPGALRAKDVPAVTGAFMMTRTRLFDRFHGWDPGFWLSCEDTDFCLNVLNAGFRVRYVPAATVYHFGSITVSGDRARENPNLRRLNRRWASKVFRKWNHFVVDPFRGLRRLLKQGRRRAVVFGTGARARQYLPVLEKMGFRIVAFADSSKSRQNTLWEGRPIIAPSEIPASGAQTVIIASMHRQEITRLLRPVCKNKIRVSSI